jgi:hypothetical protein
LKKPDRSIPDKVNPRDPLVRLVKRKGMEVKGKP